MFVTHTHTHISFLGAYTAVGVGAYTVVGVGVSTTPDADASCVTIFGPRSRVYNNGTSPST